MLEHSVGVALTKRFLRLNAKRLSSRSTLFSPSVRAALGTAKAIRSKADFKRGDRRKVLHYSSNSAQTRNPQPTDRHNPPLRLNSYICARDCGKVLPRLVLSAATCWSRQIS